MDKTELVRRAAHLFEVMGHSVQTSVKTNHSEIDIVAVELDTLTRKTILIECTEENPVGVGKLREDILKLQTAQQAYKANSVVMHISSSHYSSEALGLANDMGIQVFTLDQLEFRLVNFDPLLESTKKDRIRKIIDLEYQPNDMHFEGYPKDKMPSIEFLDTWVLSDQPWLTVLGDYGVGKSWTLKKFFYHLADKFELDPTKNPLPFFIPLQHFAKSFDFQNLIQAMFLQYGLRGVHYDAFEHLMQNGRIIFLLDSFDEMAQNLQRHIIRTNLIELLSGIRGKSKAIMTSRPTYFESRAERLVVVETEDGYEWHDLDIAQVQRDSTLSRMLQTKLAAVQFARIRDLSIKQRQRLFDTVLKDKPEALKKLTELHTRFARLEDISKRAVVARLLTTVAETLAGKAEAKTPDGYPLLPENLSALNQAKIFEIVVNNLLFRDQNLGQLKAGERLLFLRHLAVFLQRKGSSNFITPYELRNLVARLFANKLLQTDSPEQLLENMYRTCRRHAGLTTESQFLDTSGFLDTPVDADDPDARVGFSHNSIREYLVADVIADWLQTGREYPDLVGVAMTDAIADYFDGITEYREDLSKILSGKFASLGSTALRQTLFELIYWMTKKDHQKNLSLLGSPVELKDLDISLMDLSSLPLKNAQIVNCLAVETDFRKSDLQSADFSQTLMTSCMFDGAKLRHSNFKYTDIESIFVFDPYQSRTQSYLKGREARQWLYCEGAVVDPEGLNLHLGQPWYNAAREVTTTLLKKFAGSHQDVSLVKGTSEEYRPFAKDFVEHLIRVDALKIVKKAKGQGKYVVKADPTWRDRLSRFNDTGEIPAELLHFFEKHLHQ
jgi:hypothetical protein